MDTRNFIMPKIIRSIFRDILLRSVREDLLAVQESKDCKEEDAREEENFEPGIQRVIRLRPPKPNL